MLTSLRHVFARAPRAQTAEKAALLDQLLEQPEARALLHDEAHRTAERRRALLQERAAIIAEATAHAAAAASGLAEAIADVERHVAATAQARHSSDLLHAQAREAQAEYSRRREALTNELARTAPREALEAAREQLWRLMEDCARLADAITERGMNGQRLVRWSNADSIHRRRQAISAALAAVRDMADTVVDDADVEVRVEALIAALPEIEARPEGWLTWFQ